MKNTVLLILVGLCLLLGAFGGAVAEGARTLTGEFVWTDRDRSGDLEAIFTATGEGTWDVAFHFTFRDTPHVYSGTAEGSLSGGDLKGTVLNEDKKRTFTFSGSFKDGAFHGTHAEVEGERTHATGTLTLKE